MKKIILGISLLAFVISMPSFSCINKDGFLPTNDLNISVDDKSKNGMTQEIFNNVIDKIENIYSPIVSQYGGKLQVVRKWTDGTVNAYAQQDGDIWKVSMFGGLARHKTITPDGLSLVVCHELGHHIGGAPRHAGNDWASNEGQSDYFATLKCLRRIWHKEDNVSFIQSLEIPGALKKSCKAQWQRSADQALCIRGAMAGLSVSKLFASLGWAFKTPKFDTPDKKEVKITNNAHPGYQCRLDTYFQGTLCGKDFSEEIGQRDEVSGSCHASQGDTVGLRPRCWFKPN